VAASGAFPGALAAVADEFRVSEPKGPPTPRRVLLADGGLTDNTGLTLLLTALAWREPFSFLPTEHWKRWDAGLIIASDGSQPLAELAASDAALTFTQQLSRTADIVYASSGVRFIPPEYLPAPKVVIVTSSEGRFRSPDWL
jgi:hypothetical protein